MYGTSPYGADPYGTDPADPTAGGAPEAPASAINFLLMGVRSLWWALLLLPFLF